jgi:hypothetical protein
MNIQGVTLTNVGYVRDLPLPVTSGLYLSYDPASTSSSTLTDTSGNGRNGTMFNSPTISASDHYMTLNGSNQFFYTPNLYNSGNYNHTVEVWIYPTTSNISVWSDDSQQSTNTGYHATGAQYYSNTTLAIGLWGSPGQVNSVTVGPSQSWANKWTQLVRTYDGTTMKGYYNGIAGNTLATTWVAPWPSAGNNWYIGFGAIDVTAMAGTTAGWFAGRYGIVRVYNRALTSTEVNQNYLSTGYLYGL